ncbi:cationic amino acid transporter 2-like isoform X2 [Rhodnius prolixus]|uniref:cationic amino acid transporter 2-like isoform X2 n=1 Tax=Rhodnius prolixus TaxID=13249 RepID=UPI003D1888A9
MVFSCVNVKRVLGTVSNVVARKKTEDPDGTNEGGTRLAKVLGLGDLILLGVGSTLGVGVYVLAGEIAKTEAGPAVTLSFLVAAIASALAGVCYAEFAARVPKAGSAYIYSYVTVGELAAFVIGWNLILEYIIGTASVARAFSSYLDTMTGNVTANTLREVMPIHVSFLSPYPDFLSLGIVLVLTALLAWGVRESAMMNNIFTAFNLLTVVTVIIAGLFKVNASNWNIPKSEIPKGVKGGEGGFLPFGFSGVMAGAAKCFFGFVGFDCVATTGEEAKNPQRHIPLAIVTSLIIIFLAYFGISTVLTMMWPYYDQDENASIVITFKNVGMPVVSTIVSAGAIFALCTSLLGTMFPMPRMLYAIASDGLLFKLFANVNARTKTPVNATIISGVVSGIMAALFNLEQLINMMSIGTLLAYTIVALCVLLLRYRDPKPAMYEPRTLKEETCTCGQYFGRLINFNRALLPDKSTTSIAEGATTVFVACTIITTIWIVNFEDTFGTDTTWPLYVLILFLVLTCLPVIVIALQPQDQPPVFFKVPLLPALPAVSIFVNVYLMMKLDFQTWIRFAVWLIIGALIYIFYSIQHSVEGNKDKMAKESIQIVNMRDPKLAWTAPKVF